VRGVIEPLLLIYLATLLAWLLTVHLGSTLLALLGVRSIARKASEHSPLELEDMLAGDCVRPVSILVPVENEEETLVSCLRACLAQQHPHYEVVVILDGSQDRVLELLSGEFGLKEEATPLWRALATRPVRGAWRSRRYPRMLVLAKEAGGQADALNAGLQAARYPLVCSVGARTVLEPTALLRIAAAFVDDEVAVVASPLRPRDARATGGAQETMPESWSARIQIVEYFRAQLTVGAGWARLGASIVSPGSLAAFRREAAMRAGGWAAGIVQPDLELGLRLARQRMDAGLTSGVAFCAEPLGGTVVERGFGQVRAGRRRRQQGLWQALFAQGDMMFRPRYGRLGMLALPWLAFVEAAGPIVEIAAYVMVLACLLGGVVSPLLAAWLASLAIAFAVLQSQVGIAVEAMGVRRMHGTGNRLRLMFAGLLEPLGFRQVMLVQKLGTRN
jgi:cellulose synthase/poly-beta-1,6-N-acetylglucosamine synthase-like glycosyltransferase